MVEFLEVVIDLLRSLGLLTGFKCFSTAADRFEFVLLGVELLLTECLTGLTTLLKGHSTVRSVEEDSKRSLNSKGTL